MGKDDIPKLVDMVSRFSKYRILVLGDVMLDHYFFGRTERLNPEASVPILRVTSDAKATGGAGNTAKNLTALGTDATLISCNGADEAGDEIRQAVIKEGYRAILLCDPHRSTTKKLRYIAAGQHLLRVDCEDVSHIPENIEKEIVSSISSVIDSVNAIFVSDYAKGFLTPVIASTIMNIVREKNLPVMADLKPAHMDFFQGVTYLSSNRKEVCEYLGLGFKEFDENFLEAQAKMLRKRLRTSVFMTLGEKGMYVLGREMDKGTLVPQSHRVEVADTCGCGDTAAVVLLLAKLTGATDFEAARIANAAGALVASRTGAVAVTQQDLINILTAGNESSTVPK